MESNDLLFERARRAYERGRFMRSFAATPVIIALVIVSFLACNTPAFSTAVGLVLIGLCSACAWTGGPHARAVTPGLTTGCCAALIPFGALATGICVPGSLSTCMLACFVGGAIAGAAITTRALRLEEGRRSFALSGGTIAALTGALGCSLVGIGGVLGMFAGVAIAASPALIVARARA